MTEAIEIRHLRYFLAVAETSNFTRAAERLRVSQPSISQQIKDLEQALGTTLFDRLGKVVRLTQAGLAFRAGAEVVLKKLDEACASVELVEGLLSGHLEVGVIPAINVPWIPSVLERFGADHPEVTVTVEERSSNDIETEVEAGRFDLGLGLLSYASPNVTYERVTSTELALLVPDRHALASAEEVQVKELEGARLVLMPESFQIRQMVEEAFRRAKCRPRLAFEIDTIDATLAAVARTGTATVLPSIVLDGRRSLGLRAIKLAGRNLRLDLGIMWPAGSEHSRAAKLFAELVTEVATKAAGAKKGARGHVA